MHLPKITLFCILVHCGTIIILSYQSSCHLQKMREMVPITRPFERHFPIGWLLSTSADWLVHFNGPSRRHSRLVSNKSHPTKRFYPNRRPCCGGKMNSNFFEIYRERSLLLNYFFLWILYFGIHNWKVRCFLINLALTFSFPNGLLLLISHREVKNMNFNDWTISDRSSK